MTMRVIAGFDRPETAAPRISSGAYSLIPPRPGARGNAVRCDNNNVRLRVTPNPVIPAVDAVWVHTGFWYRNGNLSTPPQYIAAITGANDSSNVLLGINAQQQLSAYRQTTTYVLGTSAVAVGDGGWHHIHVSACISTVAATGRCKVWIDGVLSIDATGQTCATTSTRGVGSLTLYTSTTGSISDFDDAWLDDDNNEWFAPKAITVATLAPNGPGASTQWTPEPAGQPNWTVAGDGSDDTYISSQTAGNRDLYTFADLPAGATSVEGVSLHTRGQQVGAGTPLVKPVHRHTDGTVTLGTDISQGTIISNNAPQMWLVNPATGSPWTVADVNGAQFGIELA